MSEPLGIILMGAPGAGKSTHSDLLRRRYDCAILDTGALLRDEVARGTALGRRAAFYLERSLLVPDEVVNALIRARLAALPEASSFILDGFPRTLAQAAVLDAELPRLARSLTAVISLTLRTEDALVRLSGDLVRRADEVPALILDRLRRYDAASAPLLRFYAQRGILHLFSTVAAPEIVHTEIVQALEMTPLTNRARVVANSH